MALREFTDANGVSWRVWSTVPFNGMVPRTHQAGWLTFESPMGRRRLNPIPSGWEEAPSERLDLYCRAAHEVRLTPPIGEDAIGHP